jgi:DNA repair exonuclease SbcCD nuclease subunit
MKKPDAILVGDIHARDDQPPCRLDDFLETQKRKFAWLKILWRELYEPLVIQSGDVFHKWKSSPEVINMTLSLLPPMVTIPGNPGKHNYFNEEGFDKDALKTIELAKAGWKILRQDAFMKEKVGSIIFPSLWNEKVPEVSEVNLYKVEPELFRFLLLTHRMLLDGPAPFSGDNALEFLLKYPYFDLMVTGHNHKPFVIKNKGRLLVNPGSFTRQSSDEDHKPRVYLWYAKENKVEPVFVPIEEGVITREHIVVKEQRDERLTAFVEKLAKDDREISMDFRENLLRASEGEGVRASVKQRIMEVMG